MGCCCAASCGFAISCRLGGREVHAGPRKDLFNEETEVHEIAPQLQSHPLAAEPEDPIAGYLAGQPAAMREVGSWIEVEIARRPGLLAHERADLVQAVHTRLIANLRAGAFRGEASLRTYVSRIARNTAIDYQRRRRDEVAFDETTVFPNQGENRRIEERELAVKALRSISRECREMWKMILLDGLSHAEISQRLGVPVGTVKSRAWSCRRRLAEALNRLSSTATPDGVSEEDR